MNTHKKRKSRLTKKRSIRNHSAADRVKNPNDIFRKWYQLHIVRHKEHVDSAFVLSTVNGNKPNGRYVTLIKYEENGYYFSTNSESQKCKELRNNPNVSALFYFPDKKGTIKLSGVVVIIDDPTQRQEMYNNLKMDKESMITIIAYDKAKISPTFSDNVHSIKNKLMHTMNTPIKVPDQYVFYKIIPHEFEVNMPSDHSTFYLTEVYYLDHHQWKIKKHKRSSTILSPPDVHHFVDH